MRKGRSSRRSRISRPLVSVKGEALSTDVGPASSSVPSPRVVVGVPPSDPPPSESTTEIAETKAPATTRSSVGAKLLEAAVEAEAKAEAETVEAKVEPPPPEPPKPDLAATVVHGSSETAPAPNFAKTLAFGSKANELPQSERVEVVRERAAQDVLKEKREKAQAAQKAISPTEDPDEISVPPANDMNVEDEKFFDDADVAVRKSVHEIEMLVREEADELVPERTRRKLDPQVIRRRERFAGYVKLAVAGAAILCLAAIGRSALHSRTTAPAQAPAAIAAAPETPAVPKAAEPEVKPVEEAKPAEPVAAASASAAPSEEAPKAEEVAGDPKEELKKSRTALEKRHLPEAIEAGERSVALDSTDGEAWLILGASYQEKGDLVNAHRCYVACVKEGKTGPVAECRKMLR